MKKLCCLIALSLYLISFSSHALDPIEPSLTAKAYFLLDYQSGQTLAQHHAKERIEPASLTKLMTAYLAFGAIKTRQLTLDQRLTVSKRAWRAEGSRMFLDPKVPVTVSDLLRGMIVQSGNDACITLAEAIAGSEEQFALEMTREAHKLGLKQTQFKNATGLPAPGHYSSTYDLALLAAAVMRDFPEFYPLYALKSFTYNGITQPNRNVLLTRDPTVDGMKTGYTQAAGFNLIASSHRDGRRIISVVIGSKSRASRASESERLLQYAIRNFSTPKIYAAKQKIGVAKVEKGVQTKVSAWLNRDLYVTVPKVELSKLKTTISWFPLAAPVKLGQSIGILTVSLNGSPLVQRPVLAEQGIELAGFWRQLFNRLKAFFAGE